MALFMEVADTLSYSSSSEMPFIARTLDSMVLQSSSMSVPSAWCRHMGNESSRPAKQAGDGFAWHIQRERARRVAAAINHAYNLHLAVGHLDGFPQCVLFVARKADLAPPRLIGAVEA